MSFLRGRRGIQWNPGGQSAHCVWLSLTDPPPYTHGHSWGQCHDAISCMSQAGCGTAGPRRGCVSGVSFHPVLFSSFPFHLLCLCSLFGSSCSLQCGDQKLHLVGRATCVSICPVHPCLALGRAFLPAACGASPPALHLHPSLFLGCLWLCMIFAWPAAPCCLLNQSVVSTSFLPSFSALISFHFIIEN